MNNFFTILVIPEKTKQVKKIVIPAVYLRIGMVLGAVGAFFLAFMVYDYVNVMQQLAENKRLQTENRQLKQQMQSFTTKLQSVQDALERIQSYTSKLRIITNQSGENTESLKKKIAPDIPGIPMDDHSEPPPTRGNSGSLDFYPSVEDIVPKYWRPERKQLLASTSLREVIRMAREDSQLKEKKLQDLVREDEERESDELREEFEKIHLAFDRVLQHAQTVELDVQSLSTTLLDQKDYLESMPTLKPTGGWFTSGFGVRSSPYTGKPTMHEGLDIANHVGTPIVAPASGVVTFSGSRPGYGSLITIDHGYGIQTQYGHVSRSFVSTGEKVKRGQRIGAVGNTGRSTGPHVHYEVRVNGIPVDPYYYILEE